MKQSRLGVKLRSCVITALLSLLLLFPTSAISSGQSSDTESKTPGSILSNLIDTISEAEPIVFKIQASSAKATLIKKTSEVISMFEKGNYEAGLNKLENDIAPKLADPRPTPLADPRPTPHTSWLQLYAEGSANQKLVSSFSKECQSIVQMAQKSALPPSLREHCDFNGDGCDDLAIGVPHENIGGEPDAGAVHVLYGSNDGLSAEQDQYLRQGYDGVEGASETGDQFGTALAIGNFNGDDYDDLAIGISGEDVVYPNQDHDDYVGAVSVLYGSEDGLSTAGDQVWWQNSIAGAPYVSESMDVFGTALAAGDFNGDGWDDLAVGVPGENIHAGEVDVLYGSPIGLSAAGNQVWSQSPLEGSAENYDRFGQALTVGDFNADGYEDLAVGVPNENVGGIDYAGAVNVLFGSFAGLTATGNQIWHQDIDLVQDQCETEDYFGGSLAAGDFSGDGYDDLAIGVPGESYWANGIVNILYGSSAGLSTAGNEIVEPRYWLRDECTYFDYFGASLAAGDFDKDGYEDLAIGVPGADINWGESDIDAGAVFVIYGRSQGLPDSSRWDIWLEIDLMEGPEYYAVEDNYFGKTVAVGDFNGDMHRDLAVGVPKEGIGDADEAGLVRLIYGYADGLSSVFSSTWWQDKEGVEGDCEDNDHFGSSLPGSYWQGIYP